MFLDDPIISNIVFYPRKHKIPENLDENIKVLKFKISEKIVIGGFFFENNEKLPNILLFHGNGEIAIEYQYFIPLFFKCGVNLGVIDFRGYGFSTGAPIFSSLYTDALPIYKKFEEFTVNQGFTGSNFVLGRSLGSHCAAEIGSHNPESLNGIIFESAIGSTYRIMTQLFQVSDSQLSPDSLREWSNDTKASQFRKPTLILHGTSDYIVPNEHGRILHNAIPDSVDKKLVMIKGAGHNNIFQFRKEYFGPLKEFIYKNK
ncbi:MAG: hypothetical protein EU551_01995 [Promethearchaeota archaeon]|nr:MAG: hypothetical protein EU551_01995 [Candidatus Lokiarchaeota archaeon]